MFLKRFSVNKKEPPKDIPNPLSIESAMKSSNNIDICSLPKAEIDAFSDNIIEALIVIRDQTYSDIIILGSVCKALCRASTSITEPTKNKSLIDQLIKKASRPFENYFKNYTFNLDRAKALFSVSHFY